jgi:hypothetical protein
MLPSPSIQVCLVVFIVGSCMLVDALKRKRYRNFLQSIIMPGSISATVFLMTVRFMPKLMPLLFFIGIFSTAYWSTVEALPIPDPPPVSGGGGGSIDFNPANRPTASAPVTSTTDPSDAVEATSIGDIPIDGGKSTSTAIPEALWRLHPIVVQSPSDSDPSTYFYTPRLKFQRWDDTTGTWVTIGALST